MEKKILATIEEAVHNGDTAGANVLVIKDGKESAYCGYGMRDIENRLPIAVSYTHLTLPTTSIV